jgi:hypothetical protein
VSWRYIAARAFIHTTEEPPSAVSLPLTPPTLSHAGPAPGSSAKGPTPDLPILISDNLSLAFMAPTLDPLGLVEAPAAHCPVGPGPTNPLHPPDSVRPRAQKEGLLERS